LDCLVIVHVLILLLVLGAAGAISFVADRGRRAKSLEAPDFRTSLSFIGAAYGLLLGLLVSFAVGHYSTVRSEAQQEAGSLLTLYDTVGAYPHQTQDHVRHDLVCYMRSVVSDDWPSMEQGKQFESPRTLSLGDQLRQEVRSLPSNNSEEGSAYGRAQSVMNEANASRARLLYLTSPDIPAALWVVIYVGAFLVFLLVSMHYAANRAGIVSALLSLATLMTVVIAVLAMLDQPFGVGVRVTPDQMHQTINLVLAGEKNATILGACS
jgi:hypothetical protein